MNVKLKKDKTTKRTNYHDALHVHTSVQMGACEWTHTITDTGDEWTDASRYYNWNAEGNFNQHREKPVTNI